MAGTKKINDFTEVVSPADNDLLLLEQDSDGAYRKVTVSNFRSALDTLSELNDVTITSPSNGQVLSYNSGTSTWTNSSESGLGDMLASTYDPASIEEQLVGLTATQTLTNKDLSSSTNTFPTSLVTSNELHSSVTLAGSYDYLTISDQEITLKQVDLSTDVTGDLPVSNISASGTASSTTYLRGDGTWSTPAGGSGGAAATFQRTFSGNVATGQLIPIPIPDELAGKDIKEVRISLSALPTGQALKVDVRKNGTATTDSIFTSDTEIEIGTAQTATNGLYMTGCDISGATVGTPSTTIDSARDTLSADDVLYIYVTQVGSTTSGSDLVVTISVA